MSNSYFQFKQFMIHQDRCAMKVTTDGCLFGAWVAGNVGSCKSGVLCRESGAGKILEIGTGTGLLPLMMAQQCNAAITTVEIDTESFEQASDNLAASPWADRIKIAHADARTIQFPEPFDMIISNPPFYENELKGDDRRKNIARHNEGLLFPELLTIIKKNLKPEGSFFLLLPYKRNAAIRKLITEYELSIRQLVFVRPSIQHDFFRVILEGRFKEYAGSEIQIDEISIKNASMAGEGDTYTPAFKKLLKDYYLHL